MAGAFDDFKEQVRSRTDLVSLVGETVALQSRHGGREFVGLCPFHDDHNPSLTVSPERQSYKCWSCGEGGDCFSFVMQIERLTFPEALEMLAKRAGLEMPRTAGRRPSGEEDSRQQQYEILAWAEREFHRCLKSQPQGVARAYLDGRGFAEETLDRFGVGYHPEEWDWLQQRARGLYGPEQLHRARLVRARDNGNGWYDDLRDRIVFPIRDARGRTVAFGGRCLPERARPDAPKYLNSAESELFSKSRVLYGFDVAREAIRKAGTAIVVEGYVDCIMCHQFGLGHVVGTLGTSLTESHVVVLKRFARTVVMLYDGDEAGRRAAERSLVKFLAQDVDLRILTLPDEQDPDEFLAAHGAEALRTLVAQAPEAWDHRLHSAIARHGLDGIDARQRTLDEMLDLLVQAPRLSGTPREDVILAALSQRLRLEERLVRRHLAEARRRFGRRATPGSDETAPRSPETVRTLRTDAAVRQATANRPPAAHGDSADRSDSPNPAPPVRVSPRDERLESEILEILFAAPESIAAVQARIAPEDFRHPELRELVQICYDLAEADQLPSFERVMTALEDPQRKRLAAALDQASRDKKIPERLVEEARRTGPDGVSPLLAGALDLIVHRRREQSHRSFAGRVIEQSGRTGTQHPEVMALLQRTTEFRRRQPRTG